MYESLPDRIIREAIERGEFEDLPGKGKPIAGLDRDYDPDWWARRFMERLRAGEAVGRAAREVDHLIGTVWLLPDGPAVRKAVAALNSMLESANEAAPESERASLLDPEDVVATWRRMSAARRRRPRPAAG